MDKAGYMVAMLPAAVALPVPLALIPRLVERVRLVLPLVEMVVAAAAVAHQLRAQPGEMAGHQAGAAAEVVLVIRRLLRVAQALVAKLEFGSGKP